MRRNLFGTDSWLNPLRGLRAAWGAGAFLFLAATAGQAQLATPPGTSITNTAVARYIDANGNSLAPIDASAVVVVGQVAGVDVEPSRELTASGGSTLVLPHTVTNTGTGTDSFLLQAVSPSGWPLKLYRDVNGDGQLDAGDVEITGPLSIPAGGTIAILVVAQVPPGFAAGAVEEISVTATSVANPTVSDTAIDRIRNSGGGGGGGGGDGGGGGGGGGGAGTPTIGLSKQVNRTEARAGDLLTYTLTYRASGSGTAALVNISDAIPAGSSYVPGSLALNGGSLSDASDADAGQFLASPAQVQVRVANVVAGDSGKVSFQVRALEAAAGGEIRNIARLTYSDSATTLEAVSNEVTTGIAAPQQALTLTLRKRVDRTQAQADDLLNFTITYLAGSLGSRADVTVSDVLPAGIVYESGTLRLGNTALTDAADGDQGTMFQNGTPRFEVKLYGVQPGDSGEIRFQARVAAGAEAGALIRNVAKASWTSDSARTATSDTTRTTVIAASLSLDKRVVGVADVGVGDTVRYRIVARNPSAEATLRGLTVVDTLPAELEAVGTPANLGADGRTYTWEIAQVLPGDSAVLEILALARTIQQSPQTVLNRAYAWAAGLEASDTASLTIRLPEAAGLHIDLSAQVLEVSIGETATLLADVRNTGNRPLQDALVEIVLPPGTRYVPGSLNGAELVSVNGDRLIVRLPGTLPAGGTRSFTYAIAIVAPESDELINRATASAENGAVVSNEATAILRLRRAAPMESRTVVGRVWLDLNENGQQDEDEPGLSGVDVWSEDGAVARTDSLGKFSFVNMRTGTHLFRADPATVPTGFIARADGDGMVSARVTGWNSPHVLLPVRPVVEEPVVPGALPLATSPDRVTPATQLRTGTARTAEAREAEKRAVAFSGPGVEIFSPADGTVTARDRLFVGASAEPNMPIALFRGDTLLVEDRTRIDGVYDFVSVKLLPGPNLLRVRVKTSWNQTRWDSVMVHVSGPVSEFAPDRPALVLPADGKSAGRVRFRVLDEWGVPVASRPFVTVVGESVVITSPDVTRSSAGTQVQADEQGWAEVELQPGLKVGKGALRLQVGRVESQLPVDLVAPALPLMLTATGQFGFGASPRNFGAITARGRLDDQTSLTVSYDSRRLDDGREAFGRTVNPLSEGVYPIIGDASLRRAESAARGQLSARLARGLAYVALGDVQTTLGEGENSLARYTRSVTGAAAHLNTGPVEWTAFGAMSRQSLAQVQLRGLGTSGPYAIGRPIIAGTEQVHVEMRDRENAQRVLTRQALTAYVDYEIDYRNGTILLKRPLSATDVNGNPVYLLITGESDGGGERAGVVGVRAQADAAKLLGAEQAGALLVGASVIHDGQGLQPLDLVGGDVRLLAKGGIEVKAELAHSAFGDTTGYAGNVSAEGRLLAGRLSLGGRFMRTDPTFRNPSNMGLMGATQDLSGHVALTLGGSELRVEHSEQDFSTLGISRSRTSIGLKQSLLETTQFEARLVNDGVQGGTAAGEGQGGSGEVKLTWTPERRLKLWGEGRSQLWSERPTQLMGDYLGVGASLEVLRDVSLEARHLRVAGRGEQADYSLTNLGVRSRMAGGTQAWGSYQLVGGIDGASNAAIVGLNNKLKLGDDWSVNTMFERHVGIQRAPANDPVRALPFQQQEADFWSGGLGVEYTPVDAPYRLSAKVERKDGQAEQFTLGTIAGDVALNGSFALLARQDYMLREPGSQPLMSLGRTSRKSSILGLALRPEGHENINGLLEFRYLQEENPRPVGLVDRQGREERMIGAAELIWTPFAGLELGGRYAMRRTSSVLSVPDFPDARSRTNASYLGGRGDLDLTRWLAARVEARLLNEHRSGTRAYDVAPSVVVHAIQGIEVAAGKRWGDLRDRDFAVNGGNGWFLTVGARITEKTLPSAAAFWRQRITGDGEDHVRLDPSRLPPSLRRGALAPAPQPGPARVAELEPIRALSLSPVALLAAAPADSAAALGAAEPAVTPPVVTVPVRRAVGRPASPAAAAGKPDLQVSARVIELSPSEPAVVVTEVRNTGTAEAVEPTVEVVLPAGTAFVPGSVSGAELLQLQPDRVRVHLRSNVAVGDVSRFTYRVRTAAGMPVPATSPPTGPPQDRQTSPPALKPTTPGQVPNGMPPDTTGDAGTARARGSPPQATPVEGSSVIRPPGTSPPEAHPEDPVIRSATSPPGRVSEAHPEDPVARAGPPRGPPDPKPQRPGGTVARGDPPPEAYPEVVAVRWSFPRQAFLEARVAGVQKIRRRQHGGASRRGRRG